MTNIDSAHMFTETAMRSQLLTAIIGLNVHDRIRDGVLHRSKYVVYFSSQTNFHTCNKNATVHVGFKFTGSTEEKK
jgi:hypothetical protein